MSGQQQVWETYVSSWKAETDEARSALFARSLTPDCVYTDPLTQARGWAELSAYMDDFHQQVPGGHVVTQWFQAHHGRCMARWILVAGDGAVLGDGVSVGEFGDDGRLTGMYGCYDTPGS